MRCFYSVTSHEQVVRRIRLPRLISRDGLVRPYTPHEAMGLYILNVRKCVSLFSFMTSILF